MIGVRLPSDKRKTVEAWADASPEKTMRRSALGDQHLWEPSNIGIGDRVINARYRARASSKKSSPGERDGIITRSPQLSFRYLRTKQS